MYTGIRSSRNRISVFHFLLEQEQDFGPFFLLGPTRDQKHKQEQDFDLVRGSKSRISEILFLLERIPVYIRH
jgi:hypothetical protein